MNITLSPNIPSSGIAAAQRSQNEALRFNNPQNQIENPENAQGTHRGSARLDQLVLTGGNRYRRQVRTSGSNSIFKLSPSDVTRLKGVVNTIQNNINTFLTQKLKTPETDTQAGEKTLILAWTVEYKEILNNLKQELEKSEAHPVRIRLFLEDLKQMVGDADTRIPAQLEAAFNLNNDITDDSTPATTKKIIKDIRTAERDNLKGFLTEFHRENLAIINSEVDKYPLGEEFKHGLTEKDKHGPESGKTTFTSVKDRFTQTATFSASLDDEDSVYTGTAMIQNPEETRRWDRTSFDCNTYAFDVSPAERVRSIKLHGEIPAISRTVFDRDSSGAEIPGTRRSENISATPLKVQAYDFSVPRGRKLVSIPIPESHYEYSQPEVVFHGTDGMQES